MDDRGGQLALFSFKSAQKPRYQTAKFFRAEFPGSHFVNLQFFLRKSKIHLPSPLFVDRFEIVPSINNVQRGFTHARYASGSWLFSADDLGKQMTVYSPLRPCPICHSGLYCKQPKRYQNKPDKNTKPDQLQLSRKRRKWEKPKANGGKCKGKGKQSCKKNMDGRISAAPGTKIRRKIAHP